MAEQQKIRVAVVGGGVSALSAIYALTSTEELRNKYEVTVYQMGHRLGGKGASGRNLEQGMGKRIEEHGLHIWFGFYENAFKWMKDAYVQMHRTSGPIRTWEQAFHKHSYVVLMETMQSGMQPWTFVFPTNTDEPGTGGILPSPLAYAEMAIEWLLKFLGVQQLDAHAPADNAPAVDVPDHIEAAVERARSKGPQPRPDRATNGGVLEGGPLPISLHPVAALFEKAHTVLRSLENDVTTHTAHEHSIISWLIKQAMDVAWFFLKGSVDTNIEVRKLWVAINLTGSAVAGMIDDGVFFHGFSQLDRYDLCEWLRNNGANDTTILKSGPIRGIYDLVFGFVKGDVQQPNFAAGTALRGILRMLFTYKGALMYRMEAGMGDIVATPFYEVLKARGVKFKFFHRVKELSVSPDGNLVDRITIIKQCKLVDEASEYKPLVDVGGVPAWPSRPLFEQIDGGHELAKDTLINFESAWSAPWKDEREIVLELGTDFDQVILAASIAALADIAKPMLAANQALADSVKYVQTCQTQALQLWTGKTTTELGWQRPAGVTEAPVLGAYYEPIDTWADMSDLIPREEWGSTPVKSIAYFCGPWIDAKVIPPFSDHEFPRQELARYDQVVTTFMSEYLPGLWPNFQPGDELSRYTRVNIDPTERYVLSVKGSTKYRLRADQSGFQNVVLCGDWTQNGFNAGCVEAAVMGGLWASNALCGVPAASEILGSDRS